MSKLHLAPGLELPLDVVTQKLAFLGRTGSGKTYAATKLEELMLGAGAQIVVLDPVGVHYGLRIGADLTIPVFGGLHGDIALESTAGAIIADLIVDRGISAVLDVSQFETDVQKARFAAAFGARFFFRKKAAPSAVHVFLEECQEFVPQNPDGNETQMLHDWTRLAKLGRNFGIGLSLISQRPQEVNKKVLNMTECLFAFQMRGEQERKTIKAWSNEKALDIDIVDELPGLAVGECFVSSPQWLQVEKRVKIAKKATADVSSTPKVGASVKALARELTPIDLAELQTTMAATIEKAKAEDPKELQRRIRELEAQLRKGGAAPAPDPAAVQRQIEAAVGATVRTVKQRLDAARVYVAKANAIARDLPGLLDTGIAGLDLTLENLPAPSVGEPAVRRAPRAAAAASTAAPVRREVSPLLASARASDISRTGQRILDAIAFYNSVGIEAPTRDAVAAFVGVGAGSGSWSGRLSELRKAGLIEDVSKDKVALTAAGSAAADRSSLPQSLADLHAMWHRKLGKTSSKILELLIDAYPDAMERTAVAAMIGVSASSGSFSGRLSELRKPGLLEDVSATEVRASANLFPQGLS